MKKPKLNWSLAGNDKGAVSMITALFVIIILAVLVISFVRLMISEQRQATDDDLSNRAFYAAESGIEDAKGVLARYANDKSSVPVSEQDKFDDCEPFGEAELIPQDNLKTEITCQTVKTELPDLRTDPLDPWRSFVVPLKANSSFDGFTLQWHNLPNDGNSYSLKSDNSLPQTTNWEDGGNPYPAAMKATIITHNNTTQENMVNATRIFHLIPRSSGSSGTFHFNTGLGDNSPRAIGCDSSGSADPEGYACRISFDGLAASPGGGNEYYLLLTPLYRSTSVRLTLQNSSGDNVDIVDAQAEVDVTARAGEIFRRVRARILLNNSLLPDLAVAGNEICKDYVLREEADEFDEANRPGITDTYCEHQP